MLIKMFAVIEFDSGLVGWCFAKRYSDITKQCRKYGLLALLWSHSW